MSMFETEVVITVLEYLQGRPVYLADVTLFDTGSYQETTGKTDGLGVFTTFVRTSRYVITVSQSGYRDWVLEVGIGGELFEQLVVLTADSGGTPPDPPIVVDVAIHLNDSLGSPIVGASASLDGLTQLTNSAGIAYFSEIGISVYDYVVVADGFHQESGKIDVNNIKDLYLTLTPVEEPPPPPAEEYTLTVQVIYTDGSYAASVPVSVVRLEGGYSNGGLTDSYGTIQFKNALLGTYRVSVGTAQKEVYLDSDKTVVFQIEEPPTPPNPEPDPDTVPIDWIVPEVFTPGVHTWTMKFNILPIPFLSNWVAQLAADSEDDEARLNQMLYDQGVTGRVIILDKKVTTETTVLGAVKSYTIEYKLDLQGEFTAQASLFAFAALVPFIPALISLAGLIVIALIVNNVTSTIKEEGALPIGVLLLGGVGIALLLSKK